MSRTAALAAASLAAAALPLLSAPAHASAAECAALLEQAGHPVTDTTRAACAAGEKSLRECVLGLSEDGVSDDRLIVGACFLAAIEVPAEG